MKKTTVHSPLRRALVVCSVVALSVLGLSATPTVASAEQLPTPAPIEQRGAAAVTADPLPTVQIDSGVVWAQAVVGNTVYAGGSFTNTRPAGAAPGVSLTPRSNLLAYDIRTGQLISSFAPQVNGQIKAITASPDGSRVYVGGTFTQINGQARFNFAAFDTATGALVSTFKPAVGGSYVNAIAVTANAVYVGGLIGAGNGVTRKNLAAFDLTGKLLGWAPTTDLQVDAMVVTPRGDKVIIGGRFSTVNSVSQRGLAALDLTNGAILPWAAPQTVVNGYNQSPYAGKAGIYSLSTDGTSIYGTGWVYAIATVGNLEGTFSANPDTGAIQWVVDCHGDTYSAFSNGTYVYTNSHSHDCSTAGGMPQANPAPGNLRHAVAFTTEVKGTLSRSPSTGTTYKDWSGTPAPAVVNWFPDWTTGSATGQGQAGWTTVGNRDYIAVGGEFPYVNGVRQQGLVRFGRPSVTTPLNGPRLSGTRWVPTTRSIRAGSARITIPVNWDRDDRDLTYTLRRNGVSTPIETRKVSSTFWDTSSISFTEDGLTAGATYGYRVVATDADGNAANSNTVNVTVTNTPASAYATGVIDDGATLYWRMGTSPSADWAGSQDGTVGTGVTPSASGAIVGDSNVSSTFNGTSSGRVIGATPGRVTTEFSVEAWIRTTTTRGGKIIGFGNGTTANSSSYDRHVYMQNNGRLTFGVHPGAVRTVTSASSFNDGAWHHIVASQGAGGIKLTVDGNVVGADASVTSAEAYDGRWHVGGDNLGGWPNAPLSVNFAGDIDEFAVYPTVLSPTVISEHYTAATAPQALPTAVIAAGVDGLTASFDGSGSTAPEGADITAYAWDFGDTGTSTVAKPEHRYAAAGTYEVSLTVTDANGAKSKQARKSVTVTHAAPVAKSLVTASGLSVTASADGSTASDGATLTYVWSWGDSSPNATTKSATHTYAGAGTYAVKLTVTDSLGATSSVTKSVTVQAAGNPVVAKDSFGRTETGTWGTATTGGPWSAATGLSVSDGKGTMLLNAAKASRKVYLTDVNAKDVDATATIAIDKIADGGGLHVDYYIRKTSAGFYHLKVRTTSAGVVSVAVARTVGTTETILATKNLTGTYTAGSTINLRLQATTSGGSTALKAKAWKGAESEPAAWNVATTDSTAALQVGGQVGLGGYLTGTVTNAPVTVRFDDLEVRTLG